MTSSIGAQELQKGVSSVHDGLIAAAGRLLAPVPATPANPSNPDTDTAPDVYGGPGVPSPGKVTDSQPKPPPYPGTDGGSPYGAPITQHGATPPPLIGSGGNGVPQVSPPAGGPLGTAPPPPPGSGGLSTGAGQAGEDYNTSGTQVQGLDDRLTREINDAVAQNQQARDKITAILSEMKTYQAGVAGSGDPLALSNYQKYLNDKLAAVQQVLDDAHVNATAKQQILKDIAAEYKTSGPPNPAPAAADPAGTTGQESRASGSDPASDGTSGSGGDASGSSDAGLTDVGAAQGGAAQGLMDPFAGLGPMPGMNPMMGGGLGDALGALGGLGGLGGSLGSSLAGLGAAPLSALGPALGSLGSLGQLGGTGFTDQPAAAVKDAGAFKDDKPADPVASKDPASATADTAADKSSDPSKADKPLAAEAGFRDDGATGAGGQGGTAEQAARDTAAGDPGKAAPAAAAPASAPGAPTSPADAAKTVTLPDGTPVTAPNEQVANATRAVLGGQSVTDAYKAQGVDIPPPGAPVTAPVDPSHLQPGDIARFESRPPVMALGNGKIWMDGQVQPLSALGSSGDFLGWSKPAAPTAVSAHAVTPLAPAMPPAPGGPSPLIPPGSPRPS